jgi:hypothetical protein
MPRAEKSHQEPPKTGPKRLRAWAVTFTIAAVLLVTMYGLASTHRGGPQLGAAYRIIADATGTPAAQVSRLPRPTS